MQFSLSVRHYSSILKFLNQLLRIHNYVGAKSLVQFSLSVRHYASILELLNQLLRTNNYVVGANSLVFGAIFYCPFGIIPGFSISLAWEVIALHYELILGISVIYRGIWV